MNVFVRVGGGPDVLFFGTAVICFFSPIQSRPALAYLGITAFGGWTVRSVGGRPGGWIGVVL